MSDFPKRVVLGEGYPWLYGLGPYREVGLNKAPMGVDPISLMWHLVLWRKDVPQYRLVLELVEADDA